MYKIYSTFVRAVQNVIIIGDFNLSGLTWYDNILDGTHESTVNFIHDWLTELKCEQIVNFPTRLSPNSYNFLNLVFTNLDPHLLLACRSPIVFSDHDAIDIKVM